MESVLNWSICPSSSISQSACIMSEDFIEYCRQRIRIQFMFLHQNSRRERLNRIAFVNRDLAPRDDWSAVQRFVNVMNRAAADCRAAVQSLLLSVQPGKRRTAD